MRARTAALLLGGVLVLYLAATLWKGGLALYDGFRDPSLISGLLGLGMWIFGFIGAWFLVKEIKFGFATERMAVILDEEGELRYEEIDALPRSAGGRVNKAAADALFADRKADTEASPGDWRCWYRLAAAYSAAKDSSRARAAMRHAIRLYAPARSRSSAQGIYSTSSE
jgi:hypothetical protein